MDHLAKFDGMDPEHLPPPFPMPRIGNNAIALVEGLKSVPSQHRHVNQDIRFAVVLDYKAIALVDIEPFDAAADLV